MKRYIAAVFLFLAALLLVAWPLWAADRSDEEEIALHHVMVIQVVDGAPTGRGSGTAVTVPGIPGAILTAAHVCASSSPSASFIVLDRHEDAYTAAVVRADSKLDLCLLSAPTLSLPPARVSAQRLQPGDRVLSVVGIFFSSTLIPLVEHRWSGEHTAAGTMRGLVVPSVHAGDSGGGLWHRGELAGVVIGQIEHPVEKSNLLGVIVLLQDVRSFLGVSGR